MEMSFREKSAWACLVTTGVVYLPYFAFIGQLIAQGRLLLPLIIVAFVGAVIAQVVLMIVYQSVIALRTRQEPKDERDRAIELVATRNAHWVLVVALWLLVPGGTMLTPIFPVLSSVLVIGQLGLLCFVLSELVNYGTQVYAYRTGA